MSNDKTHLFEDFTLDLTRGFLMRGDELVHLRPQTYEVLKYLVENRGRLISKDKLLEDVWQGRAVTDGSLGKCIEEVREALGDHALKYIRNVRGRGYIFDSEPRGAKIEATSEQIDVLRVVVVDEEKYGGAVYIAGKIRKHKFGFAVALSVLLLGAVGLGYWFFAGRLSNSTQITSVAVLPFLNESGDPNTEYLSDGISESLINSLSQLPQLKVIARGSSFMYKGKQIDPQEVANALGVQGIVTGRIVQRADNLLISVELVNARDKTQMWGGQYNRKAADLQGVQEEIARTISEKLRLRLTGAQEQQLTKRATQNPQAYQLYLNGFFYLRKGAKFEDARKALDYFNQAVALDPDFALAWVGVARTYRFFAGNSLLDPKEALIKAKAAVRRALELDQTLAAAHWVMAGIKQNEWDWAGAEGEYKRAIELNPNLADAHFRYAEYLSMIGRHTEALAEIKRAEELDPLRDSVRAREADTLFLARRYDEAIEILQNAIKLTPESIGAHFTLGYTYAAKGMSERAINEFQKVISIQGETTTGLCYLGYALAMSGKRSEARAILDKLKTTKEYVSPTELAVLYVGLGDNDGAIASLEKAYAAHDLQLQTLKVDPGLDRLRSDPRFQNLVRKVGLPL
jgi:TolB-like protein/DNA-binding winged helix-turn-helix (wHTH) protein/Flp pilus assembly protein TadD